MTEESVRQATEDETAADEAALEEQEEVPGEVGNPAAEAGGRSPEEIAEQEAEEDLESESERLRTELNGLHDRHLRLAAEFENYRRRAQNEMGEAWVRAQADLVRRLLDVIDDMQRVSQLDLENATVEAIMEGIDLVERKMLRALGDAGVEVLEPVGEAFDPSMMEAMMRVPAEDEDDDDVVDQVFQKGYVLKGHLVRPARVSVRKHE